MTRLDLTEDRFCRADFCDSKLYFEREDFKRDLTTLRFKNSAIRSDLHWCEEYSFIPLGFDCRRLGIELPGFSSVVFSDNVGFDLSISLYDESLKKFIIEGGHPKEMQIRERVSDISSVCRYEFMCVLNNPAGYCHLKFWSKGTVEMKFDESLALPFGSGST